MLGVFETFVSTVSCMVLSSFQSRGGASFQLCFCVRLCGLNLIGRPDHGRGCWLVEQFVWCQWRVCFWKRALLNDAWGALLASWFVSVYLAAYVRCRACAFKDRVASLLLMLGYWQPRLRAWSNRLLGILVYFNWLSGQRNAALDFDCEVVLNHVFDWWRFFWRLGVFFCSVFVLSHRLLELLFNFCFGEQILQHSVGNEV